MTDTNDDAAGAPKAATNRTFPDTAGTVRRELMDLVGLIYEASYDVSRWVDVLQGVAALTGSNSAALMYRDDDHPAANFNFTFGVSDDILRAYESHFYAVDPFFKLAVESVPIGKSAGDHEMVPDRRELEAICGEFFTGYMQRFDIWHCGGVTFFYDNKRYAAVSIHRGRQQGPWPRERMDELDMLVPHFQRATRIHKEFTRMRLQEQAFLLALDRLIIGLVLLDKNAEVVYSNPMADRILVNHPAITRATNNTLRATDREENTRLGKLIKQATAADETDADESSNALGLRHRNAKLPLPVMVAPVDHSGILGANAIEGAHVALMLADPEQTRAISPHVLSEAYGLTRAEAMVAIGIANGMTIDDLASSHGTSRNTVKTQLKHIFQKVDVTRQAELVKALLTGPYSVFAKAPG